MVERIARPPVRIKGAVPDGNLNGTGQVSQHFLKADPGSRLAVVEFVRRERVFKDDTGAEVAVLGIAGIEFPTDQDGLRQVLVDHRALRTGSEALPFPVEPADGDADKARELERRIEAHYGDGARAEWVEYFGPGDEAPVGPTGAALTHLMEFVGERRVPALGLDALVDTPDQDDDDSGEVDAGGTAADDDEEDDDPEDDGRVVQFSGGKK